MSTCSSTRVSLRVDVTGSISAPGRIEMAATVFLPDFAAVPAQPIVLFAIPGAGYSRGYFDLQLPDHGAHSEAHGAYSEARYYTARGLIVVAMDPLGVGESTLAGLNTLRIEDLASANDAAARKIAALIAAGTLAAGFPAVPRFFKVGIGQSMGGGITIITQGRHRTYDAIAALGYSAIQTTLPGAPTGGLGFARGDDPAQMSLPPSSVSMADLAYLFHWEDVPKDIRDADMDGYPARKTPQSWGSQTIPNCAMAMTSPGYVAAEAAVIDVPVLMAMGERDVVPIPMDEPRAFKKARDVSVFVVPRMAHMHNFASTREMLWARLAAWVRMVAEAQQQV